MATILNADTVSGGAVITGDGSGTLELQSAGVTKLTVDGSGVTLATPLPVASGGTGSTSAAFVDLASNVTGTLPVANGGTGAATLTANNVLLGNGASALQAIAPGTSGNVLASNGTTWASSAPTFGNKSLVATGSLSSGQAVALRIDGTVEGIYAERASLLAVGTQLVVSDSPSFFYGSAIDPVNQKIVTLYGTNNSGPFAVVSTLSGTTIVSGAANTIASGVDVSDAAVCFDSANNVFVFVYRQTTSNSNYVVVGSVSGTTITFGTPVVISTSASQNNTGTSITFDSVNSKVVITYSNGAAPSGFAVVGTVSGTSITLGTPVQYAATSTLVSSCFHQNNGKVVIFYYDTASTIAVIVGTVSGTNISFGTAVSSASATAGCFTAIVYDPIYKKVVLGYRRSTYYAKAGVVSGTSISFETEVQISSTASGIGVFSAAYDYAAQQAIFTYVTTTVVGVEWVSVATTAAVKSTVNTSGWTGGASNSRVTVVYDAATKQSVYFFKNNSTGFVNGYTVKSAYPSNITNFFGITEAAISSGASGNVSLLGGINSAQTGLFTESSYFVDTSGALTTTPTSSTVYVGVALSPTSIQIGSTTASSFGSRNVGMVLLAKTTVSGVVNVDFDDYFTSAYKNYMVVWSDVINGTTTANDLKVRLKFAGSYQTGTSTYTYSYLRIGGATYSGATAAQNTIELGSGNVPASSATTLGGGYLYLFDPLNATKNKMIVGNAVGSALATGAGYTFSGVYTGTSGTTACQGIRLLVTTSAMSGTFALYGIVS